MRKGVRRSGDRWIGGVAFRNGRLRGRALELTRDLEPRDVEEAWAWACRAALVAWSLWCVVVVVGVVVVVVLADHDEEGHGDS